MGHIRTPFRTRTDRTPGGRRPWRRALTGLALAGALVIPAAPAVAAPAAPSPMTAESFTEFQNGLKHSDSVVGDLAARVAESRAAIDALEIELGTARESVNRAMVDLRDARDKAAAAENRAELSGRRLQDTRDQLRDAQATFNDLARAVARQGRSTSSAFGGAAEAADALGRAGALRREADRQRAILEDLIAARTRDANADARARQDRADARTAVGAADQRKNDAEAALEDVYGRLAQAQGSYDAAQKALSLLEQQLAAAREAAEKNPGDSANDAARDAAKAVAAESGGAGTTAASRNPGANLPSTSDQGEGRSTDASASTVANPLGSIDIEEILGSGAYGSSGSDGAGTPSAGSSDDSTTDDATDGTDSEEPSGTPIRTPEASPKPGNDGGIVDSASREAKIELVVNRALGQLGVPYAWGGGNASGPTKGIRDGGVADAHGDYNKIGFDCSGLTLYAYAGIGIDLPHYTGYQYQRGTHYPKSQMKRGDLLFWGNNGHGHVALYLGDGKMVEAPQSGDVVKISKVRYDSMTPNVVRLL